MENNTNNISNVIQQGFRTVIGATATAVETLQDNQKRNQALQDLVQEWQEKSQQWSEKGTITEQEAKKIIEQFFKGYNSNNSSCSVVETEANKSDENGSIQELTQEIIALREQIQQLNSTN